MKSVDIQQMEMSSISDKCGVAEEAHSCELAFIMRHNSPLTPEVSAASHLSQSHAQLAMNCPSAENLQSEAERSTGTAL